MARVDGIKAQKILMYLWAQGFKYKEMATEAGLGLGWDIINYLKSVGHTLDSDAEKRLACDGDKKSFSPVGIGIAGNTYSEVVGIPWQANDPVVAETFGMSAFDVDTYFGIGILGLKLDPSRVKAGVVGGGMNYGGRNVKPSKAFNRTGWDLININQIADSGKVDSNWVDEVISGSMAAVKNTKYEVGSGLATFGATLPTPTPSGAPAPTPTATPSAPAPAAPAAPAEEEEEIPVPEPEPAAPSEFDEYLETDDLSIWWNGADAPTIEVSDREVSSKAWKANSGKFRVPMDSPLRIDLGVSNEGAFDLETFAVLLATGDLEFEDYESIMEASSSNLAEAIDEDGEEYDTIATPSCYIIFENGQVYFGIEGFGTVPATLGADFFTYSQLDVVTEEPSAGGAIVDVLVNKTSILEYLGDAYGFPYEGFQGLENRFKADNYTDEGAGKTAQEQATAALAQAYRTGYRKVPYAPTISEITFDKATLGEEVLQPLALDFDTELDLDNEAVYFTLLFSSSKDASNLFTGFDINNSGDTNQESFLLPFDIRNLRPVNEAKKVMDPAGRKEGEGIASIRVASKDAKSGGSLTLGKTYDITLYSQIEVTDDDGNIILIPDADERFEALDNQGVELKGTVATEAGRPALMVLKGALDIADIEKHMIASRRSARLSTRYNAIDEVTGKVDTKTIMLQQGDNYYIVVGVGGTTYALKIRGD